jgi:hypothetical protein
MLPYDAFGEDPSRNGAVYIGDDPNPVWKVYLFHQITPSGSLQDSHDECAEYWVEVDSVAGEVKLVYQRDYYNHMTDHGYEHIVLHKVVEEVDSIWEEAPSPYG